MEVRYAYVILGVYLPIGSMALVYLPSFTIKDQPNVGKYTIHGSYGI